MIKIAVGANERLLGDILCLRPLVDEAVGKTVYVSLVSCHKVTKGSLIP